MSSQGQLSCQLCNQTQWLFSGLPSCRANKQRPQGTTPIHGLSSSASYTLLHSQINRDPPHTHISARWSTRPPLEQPLQAKETECLAPGSLFCGAHLGSDSKVSAYNVGNPGSIPGLGRSPGEGNGNLLQYSCLENPMDGGAW